VIDFTSLITIFISFLGILVGWSEAFLISITFVIMYYTIFTFILKRKINLMAVVIGATITSIFVFSIETYLYFLFFNIILIFYVLVGPTIEELVKFSTIGWAWKNQIKDGFGIGLGFAITENAIYYHNFFTNIPLFTILLSYILLRGFIDPLLHSFTASLDAKTWVKRNPLWLMSSIGIHMSYNFIAISISFMPITNIYIIGLIVVIFLFIGAFFITRKDVIKEIQIKKDHVEVLKDV
jgi:RsiW-degrading membrane proteinase PrsW (M82 family)